MVPGFDRGWHIVALLSDRYCLHFEGFQFVGSEKS